MGWIKINGQPVNVFYITDISKVNTLSSGLCGTRIYYDLLRNEKNDEELKKKIDELYEKDLEEYDIRKEFDKKIGKLYYFGVTYVNYFTHKESFVYSKLYKTKIEAQVLLDEFLKKLNEIESRLPKIEI
nr:MAG TPA: hypothetical protein [Caudoviricetes sp.]